MNGERRWLMSHILYSWAANYDWKHLENSKNWLEKSWILFVPKKVGTLSVDGCWMLEGWIVAVFADSLTGEVARQ